MPWEKQFDESDVLEKAMEAFLAHGFTATSVQDLVDCTGLNRGSIYAAFGDKRSFFLKALEHYETRHRRTWFEALRRRHTPRVAILSVFTETIAAALSGVNGSSCFLVNTAIELSSHDEGIAQAVAAGLSETETFFRDSILAGQRLGEIPPHVDPARTARTLLGLLTGLRVLARGRPERPLLEALADQAAALLE